MDTLEEDDPSNITAAEAVHHEAAVAEQDDDDDEERRTRIMELAQQQQMTIQLLDEVVANQRNLSANRLRRRRLHRDDDSDHDGLGGEGHQEHPQQEEEEEQPANNNNNDGPRIIPRRQQHQPHHNRHHREGRSLFTVTQIYFIVSALFAFLAVVTSPSNIGMTASLSKLKYYSFDTSAMKKSGSVATNNHHGGDVVVEKSAVKNYRGGVDINLSKGQHHSDGAVGTGYAFIPNAKKQQHQQRRSMKSNSERAPHKKKVSSSDLSWEELLIEAFENIRDHYKEQYLILQNFWMYGSLTNLSDPSTTDRHQPFVWSLFPWTWGKNEESDKLIASTKKNGGTAKNNNFSLYSIAMGVIDPSPYNAASEEKAAPTAPSTTDRHQPFVWSLFPWTWGKNEESDKLIASTKKNGGTAKNNNFSLYSIAMGVIDPSPYNAASEEKAAPTADIPGSSLSSEEEEKKSSVSLAEKILSSTPRLIAIANLLLALVYLFHAAIADLFLGTSTVTLNNPFRTRQRQQHGNTTDEQTRRQRRVGRERLGGYLLFKLLLISSVLDPDTEDLLILFSWYMVLSFLRSLAHLAGSTANHAIQSGQSPRPGALKLLIAVLICDIAAAVGCIVLFRGAGWHMLLLLTCDCALVGADTLAHIVKHFGSTMEESHRSRTSSLEEELANIRRRNRERSRELLEQYRGELLSAESEFDISTLPIRRRSGLERLDSEVARLEQEIEQRELVHMRRMKIADVAVFGFELSALILTMAHFLHIWAWHGASFGLVDFVLALHLHSTISIIGKKVSQANVMRFIFIFACYLCFEC